MSENHREADASLFVTMAAKSALVIGGGELGSFICEMCVRSGMGHIAVLDKKYCKQDSIPKSSFALRYPEDIHKSKAHALADNLLSRCKDGCSIRGFNVDLESIGPLALAEFDYVIVATDDPVTKQLAEQLVRLCPEQRPLLIRCDAQPEALGFAADNTSIRYTIEGTDIHPEAASDGLAAMKCAVAISELLVALATESPSLIATRQPLQEGRPLRHIAPPSNVITLKGSTYHTTLRALLEKLSFYCAPPLQLKVHALNIPGDTQGVYDRFVLREKCRVCGEDFALQRHSGDLRHTAIVCSSCAELSDRPCRDFDNRDAVTTGCFSLTDTPAEILDKRLLELGYPIGCYYETESPLNPGAYDDTVCRTVFSLNGDRLFLTEA